MDVKIFDLQKAVHGKFENRPSQNFSVTSISTDSRTMKKGACFIALKGEWFDGHDYLGQVAADGAFAVVVNQKVRIPQNVLSKTIVIRVKDTLKAYGDLAHFYRNRFKVPVIAITGSSGKTTVKELLSHVLSFKWHTLKNEGTENNLIGVPKTIFKIDKSHQIVVLEMGTSLPGEIGRLSQIASPNAALITQVGESHLEGFGSLQNIYKEKTSIAKYVRAQGFVILNATNPYLAKYKSRRLRLFRAGADPDWTAENIRYTDHGMRFSLQGREFRTRLLGEHNVMNCVLVAAMARKCGLTWEEIEASLSSFHSVKGRFEKKLFGKIEVIDDTYNANPISFAAGLNTFDRIGSHARKAVICGDMLELGRDSEKLHRTLGARLAKSPYSFIITCGKMSHFVKDEAVKEGADRGKIHHVKDSAEAGRLCARLAQDGDLLYVKGSRGMKMEKVFEALKDR